MHETKLSASTTDGLHIRLGTFCYAFRIRLSWCVSSLHDRFQRHHKVRAHEMEARNETEFQQGKWTCPNSFWPAFWIRLKRCETLNHVEIWRQHKIHVCEIDARKKTESQTRRMDFICAKHISVCFLNPLGSVWYFARRHVLTASKHLFVWNRGTKWNSVPTPWTSLVCVLPHFGMNFGFVRVDVKLCATTGCKGIIISLHMKPRHGMKMSAKQPEWT